MTVSPEIRMSRRRSPLPAILAVVVAVGALGAGGWLYWQMRTANIAHAKQWWPAGKPCPVMSKADFEARSTDIHQAFIIDTVTWARGSGAAMCDTLISDGGKGFTRVPVCQFSFPAALKITTPKGEYFFAPVTGRATVQVPDGTPQCVMAANGVFYEAH